MTSGRPNLTTIFAALTLFWSALPARAENSREACDSLTSSKIPAASIGLPTSGATIDSATLIPAEAPDNANGSYCKVLGSIHPVDPLAPDIRFEVNLPDDWNGKALHYGGGGYDGNLITGLTITRFAMPGSPTPLRRGYVTFGSDSGHQSPSVADGSFAMKAEALVNFGGAQLKKTHDVAIQLILRRYGAGPSRTYFFGNSQGGHEGFIVIQRWPQDYDGVVSIHPVYDFTALQLDGNALANPSYSRRPLASDPFGAG
jgi:hypothetical protein